jgi:glycosyltransferase involved in cell wall biosynthesis
MKRTYPKSVDFCVLIPCYNNLKGLCQSIFSIEYSPENYVVLVIDDGSCSPVSLDDLYAHIPSSVNIIIVRNEENLGITKSLNRGLEYISSNFTTPFIARLDCGDICSPDRFYKQVAFLHTHTEIDLVGSWCYFKNFQSGGMYKYITPTLHYNIERSMYFRNVFIHPTVMWRSVALQQAKYPEQYPCAEDYGLFYEMVCRGRSAILDDFLVTCEINRKGLSCLFRDKQLKSRSAIIKNFGTNRIYRFLGVLKLRFLMLLPFELILQMKKMIYRVQ